jgi:hypothetical protein
MKTMGPGLVPRCVGYPHLYSQPLHPSAHQPASPASCWRRQRTKRKKSLRNWEAEKQGSSQVLPVWDVLQDNKATKWHSLHHSYLVPSFMFPSKLSGEKLKWLYLLGLQIGLGSPFLYPLPFQSHSFFSFFFNWYHSTNIYWVLTMCQIRF